MRFVLSSLPPVINLGQLTWTLQEIKPGMIELMKPKLSFAQSEIQDGDIICFQVDLPEKEYVISTIIDVFPTHRNVGFMISKCKVSTPILSNSTTFYRIV